MTGPDDPYSVVTITQASDGGDIQVDVGDLDLLSAHTMLRLACEAVWEALPEVYLNGEEAEVGEDEE